MRCRSVRCLCCPRLAQDALPADSTTFKERNLMNLRRFYAISKIDNCAVGLFYIPVLTADHRNPRAEHPGLVSSEPGLTGY
jgi:hypothetical protein